MKKGKVSKFVATALLAGVGSVALTGCTKDETGDKRLSRDSNPYTYDPTTDEIICKYGVEIDPNDTTTEYEPSTDDMICEYGVEIEDDTTEQNITEQDTTENTAPEIDIYDPDIDTSVEVYGPPEDFED